jgi:chromatin remodeling complex protein RSC6
MAQGRQSGLQRPMKPSKELADIVGPDPLPRSQVVSKV